MSLRSSPYGAFSIVSHHLTINLKKSLFNHEALSFVFLTQSSLLSFLRTTLEGSWSTDHRPHGRYFPRFPANWYRLVPRGTLPILNTGTFPKIDNCLVINALWIHSFPKNHKHSKIHYFNLRIGLIIILHHKILKFKKKSNYF